MIISKSTKPEYSLYFLGCQILKIIKDEKISECDVFFLFEIVKKRIQKYSFSQHLLALNWLYLLDIIMITPEGNLKICS